MKFKFTILLLLAVQFGFAQDSVHVAYKLSDFYLPDPALDLKVKYVYEAMTDEQRVGQVIMPAAGKLGKSTDHVLRLVREGKIGGIILLNGTREQFKQLSHLFDSTSRAYGFLPLIFSADAELSLINMKIKETVKVKYANKIKSEKELIIETKKIADELNYMNIQWDFAPVVDLSPNLTVSFRSFGLSKDTIVQFSKEFIRILQENNIIATAKHFPGHGYVVGDTHKQLVFIDGDMREVEVYVPLIQNNVLSIMIGHIAIKNNEKYNTDNLPSTVSKKIVTGLLREEMGFKGLIITDAMGMGGVSGIAQNGLKAAMAGCDIILMPKDEDEVYKDILNEIKTNEEYRIQFEASVKRILRMKICLGLIK